VTRPGDSGMRVERVVEVRVGVRPGQRPPVA